MLQVLLGVVGTVTVIGGAYIVRDLLTRPVAEPEHHECGLCHDRGAILNEQGRPIVCPSLPCRRRARWIGDRRPVA